MTPGVGRGESRFIVRMTRSPAADLRLLALLLAAGNGLFLLRMLAEPAYGVVACLLMAATLWPLFGGRDGTSPARRDARLWLFAGALALLICLLGGEGRLFYANADWQNRDAILADLARRPWPLTYAGVDGGDWVMRAPLGMYVLPALAGRMLGWQAGHPALLLQNAALLAVIFHILLSGTARWRDRLLTAAVLVAFSGWDLVGQLVLNHFVQPPAWAGLFPHLENWARGLQYSSLVTDLFWAPHHALPALAMLAAYVCWQRGTAGWLHLAAITGLGLLWSPFAVMGAAPFVLMAGLSDLRRRRMAWPEPAWLAPLGAALLPVALYLTLAAGAVEAGVNNARPLLYGVFVTLEVVTLLYLARRQARLTAGGRADWSLAAVILLSLPLFKIGQANDLMMRATIFPIALLALMTAEGLAADLAADLASPRKRRMIVPLAVLAIGAATPAAEFIRAFAEPVNPPKGEDFITAWDNSDFRDFSKAPYLAPASDYARRRWLLKQPTLMPSAPASGRTSADRSPQADG